MFVIYLHSRFDRPLNSSGSAGLAYTERKLSPLRSSAATRQAAPTGVVSDSSSSILR